MKHSLIVPAYYGQLIFEVWSFLKQPTPAKNTILSTREKMLAMVRLYLIKMVLVIMVAMFMAAISPWFDPENISKSSMATRFSPLGLILVGGFILPTLEEVGFRLSLRFRPLYLSLTTAVITYYVLTQAVFDTSNSMIDDSFITRVTGSVVAGVAVSLLLLNQTITSSLSSLWQRRFGLIFYISCFVFAAIHILNYELNWVNLLFLPLIVFPQMLSAILYGYTRVVFGFRYPLALHCANNLMAIGISLLPFEDLII